MEHIITKHLRLWASTDFVWSVSDCSIVLADYVLDVTGKDGAAHLRGKYDSALSCARLLGGRPLAHVVSECAANVGLKMTFDPVRGDIGVILVNDYQVGALFLGESRWAVKSTDGLLNLTKPPVIYAWSVQG